MKHPAHLAFQPFGQIPTFEEGDLTLFETGAIMLHIAERHVGLLPSKANARARAITWMLAGRHAGDLMMVSVLLRLKASGMLDGFPNLSAYLARGEARPGGSRPWPLHRCSGLKGIDQAPLGVEVIWAASNVSGP